MPQLQAMLKQATVSTLVPGPLQRNPAQRLIELSQLYSITVELKESGTRPRQLPDLQIRSLKLPVSCGSAIKPR